MRPTPSALLAKAKCKGMLISDLTNIRYLSGMQLSAGLLLVEPKRYTLFVDGRYGEEARTRVLKGVRVCDLALLATTLSGLKRIAIEAHDVTLDRMQRWKKLWPKMRFQETHNVVEEFRRQKSPQELALLRSAEKRTKALLRAVPALLRVGVAERDVAWSLRTLAVQAGGDDLSFDPIVAFGSNSSRPHHRAGEKRLKKGEMVQVDIGVRFGGYCGDLSEVYFPFGKTPEQKVMHTALKKCVSEAKKHMKVGCLNRDSDAAARRVLRDAGYEQYFTHALGHGVGLEVHEGVTLSVRAPKTRLLKGEVVTVEPGIYLPGRFGMRLEEMVFV